MIQRPATTLREGSHVITAKATDASGLATTSIVNIAVMRVTPTNLADLAISRLAVPTSASLGDNLSFSITVVNQGPNNASGVKVTNTLPASVSFVGATLTQGAFTQSGQTVVCTLSNLVGGAEATLTLNVRAVGAETGSFASSISGDGIDPNPANNTATATTSVQPPRLQASLTSTQLILSWPASVTGFSLQSAASLSPPVNWQPVSATANLVGDRNTVTVSLPLASQFYRLARP